ncbi:TerB N-terminal domain-containing protein [Psychromarinibacter sp. C21-152]|uniref:TerB N-terminal domain-containing protein n=1 Tax=Psychromarinibacter sediminicola TaxID=3033385 RepID=A0AAE3TCI1_9RHOB|nr:TerB N-terminal domain-containing protein [Psychromarinibacter sediminicola]MDF0603670.1 TerB N-terminal domain-containing protein [Psychromarinibacter sediminicola]
MKAFLKLLRILFFFAVYFCIALLVVAFGLQGWPVGGQMLFAFGVPVILVSWQEKRRSRKIATKSIAEGSLEIRTSRPEPVPRPSAYENRIERERERTREANASKAPVAVQSYSPPKQDYAEIVRAGKSAAPALAAAAERNQPLRTVSSKSTRSTKSGWVPSGETASVAGRNIGGMVYVGTPPLLNTYGYRDKCRAYIDPSLSVARSGADKSGEGMPYWPGYSDISPQCRATYLDWLASGRNDASYNPGYMFLYFYGLERRFFVDQSNEDAKDIVQEVRRLQSLYPDNHSVRRYLGEFLDIAMLAETDVDAIEPIFERQGWELPFSLKYAIGARIDKGENLSADWLLSWFICHPETNLRTPAARCRDEFIALFRMRFDRRFPDGLKVTKPRKSLTASYRAASSEFQGSLNPTVDGKPVPDISGLRKPVEIAQVLADEVMNELDKLSRFLGRNPDARGSVEAHALLPSELWQSFPSEEMDRLKTWANEIVERGGLVPLKEVIVRLEGETSGKIGKRQMTGAADALARLGFGLAPDPRFALRSPKPEEPVVLFSLGEPIERLEDVSVNYRSALMELALGSFVAHADGRIAEPERKVLEDQVSATVLSDQERRRLRANLEWFLAVPPDMTLLRRKLKEVGQDSQAAIRAALVGAAHADGIIHSDEVASIEKVYKALGLDPALAYSDLHAGEITDGPRTVRASQPGRAGEAIPDLEKASGPKLDASRIAAIRSDTERVSSVLGQIFDVEEEESGLSATANQSQLAGLDPKHGALVLELVNREHWSETEFEKICASHGLMAAGALEVVNEWGFEIYDEALLDEYDGYDVSPEIAEAIKKMMETEVADVETQTT